MSIYPPLTVLRPPIDEHDDIVMLSDAWNGRTARISRVAMLEYVTSKIVERTPSPLAMEFESRLSAMWRADNSRVDPVEIARARHWLERGWHGSLEYYLWSRRCKYFDEQDPDANLRREAVARFLREDGPPQRRVPGGTTVGLSAPGLPTHDATLGSLLMSRRTIRGYSHRPIEEGLLSSVLWWTLTPVRRIRNMAYLDPVDYLSSFGTAFDFYVAVYSVDGVATGIHYYDPRQHEMTQIRSGPVRDTLSKAMFGIPAARTANFTVILCADFNQASWRYRHDRELRNLYIEAGYLGQRFILTGAAYGLATLVTPAIKDREVASLLSLDAVWQAPMYTITMGMDPRRLALGGNR